MIEAKEIFIPEIGLSTESTIESLRYGRFIQDSILCNRHQLKSIFGDFAIVYEPKNILSGDFYFCTEKEDKKILAVCDCTGHGIAGALLTILGHNMIDRSLKKYTDTGEILTYLNHCICESFDSTSKFVGLGMDMVLLSIDKNSLLMNFSGSKRPICILRGDELICMKTSKRPIGSNENLSWESFDFQLKKRDKIFIFTDGYTDQFGDVSGTKFGIFQLKNLFKTFVGKPIQEINQILNETLIQYRGDEIPTDDVLLLGIEV